MTTPIDCCPIREQAKADRLDQLFFADGRNNPDHPMRGLYTGLHAEDLQRRAAALNPEPAL